MKQSKWFKAQDALLLAACALLCGHSCYGQFRREQGRSIGTVTTDGNLIVMTLNKGALGKANLFDLDRRTLRFTPDGSGYRAESMPLQWDASFGAEIRDPDVTLHNFTFPFSGKQWNSFSVGMTGSIRFGPAPGGRGRYGFAARAGGISIARFDALGETGRNIINTVPALCVFFKPRMHGRRYVKELDDRVVITWDLTEPYGNIQDFTWTPTVNRFQAVLRRDGTIEYSYDRLHARDAIVGVYPLLQGGAEQQVATISGEEHPGVPAHLDLKALKLTVSGGILLKATLETRGPALAQGDEGIAGIAYRIYFDDAPAAKAPASNDAAVWTIRGVGPLERGPERFRYFAFGPGLSRAVHVDGDAISVEGTLPPGIKAGSTIWMRAEAEAPGNPAAVVARIGAHRVKLTGVKPPEVNLSAVERRDGPFPVIYESFHYLALPNMHDLACTVIKGLGDKFDFLAYYSDFRVDNQEAGTPSDGPLGGNVTGIGAKMHGLADYCSAGRFQWGFIQPVYAGAIQMQAQPPAGITDTDTHNIVTYKHQLSEATPDGKMPAYNYAMSQIGHEMGHRWAAFVSAKVDGKLIPLGPVHWDRGLQARVPFPYQRPVEASAMGGGVWQDNFDGTYTQLDDNYYVPATGYSYLDLYLMGLISPKEVPDFFILRNLVRVGTDKNGHPIFKADRTKITIDEVIAAEGPRLPDVYHSQRKFNTGMVVIVEHGAKPSKELIERTNAIRKVWMAYFSKVTGGRAVMTATP
jgi:hypothetical protein